MGGMPLTMTAWSPWRSLNHVEKRCVLSIRSGPSGQNVREHVAGEPRGESVNVFKVVQRRARGWDLLKRLRIATLASVLLGLTGLSGLLAQRPAEVAASGGRELAWQPGRWEVSSVLDLGTSSRNVALSRAPFGRNGRSGLLVLAVVGEARPPRGENASYRGQEGNWDARGNR